MKCPNCGSIIVDGVAACPYCGVNIATQSNPYSQVPPQQPNYQDPYSQVPPQQPNYQDPYSQVPPQQPNYQDPYSQVPPQQPVYPDFGTQTYQTGYAAPSEDAKSAKKLGIVALVFSFLFPIVAWVCGSIGLSKVKKVLVSNPADPVAQSARKLIIAAFVISIINAIIGAVSNAGMFY